MSYAYPKSKTVSPSQAIEDSKKKASLLKDNSWIRKASVEDEPSEPKDTNFGRAVLGRFKSQETLNRPSDPKKPDTVSQSSSVLALSKRFSASQDELAKSSTLPSSGSKLRTTTSTTTKSFSTNDGESGDTTVTTITTTRSSGLKSSLKTEVEKDLSPNVSSGLKSPLKTTVEKDWSSNVSSGLKSPLKTEVEKDWSSNVTSKVTSTKTIRTEVTPMTPTKDSTEKMTFISSTKSNEGAPVTPPKESTEKITTVFSTKTRSEAPPVIAPKKNTESVSIIETIKTEVDPVKPKDTAARTTVVNRTSTEVVKPVIPKESSDSSVIVTTTKTILNELGPVTSTKQSTERSYINTLEKVTSPTSRTSFTTYSSSDYSPSTRVTTTTFDNTYLDSSYDRSISSSVFTSPSYTSNRTMNFPVDDVISTSKSLYTRSERSVLEKDICSSCRKPMNTEPKMILNDIQINCHAACFKCEVCNGPLGHLKAGDTMWVYRRAVHCESCFSRAREQWQR
ncbi:sciellin isoform X3 [Brienomyrus brachyistius]|uniref:sciellin isoform X3 n=1 Tax=Brienomyrus brachyistius TaxID=42636 RepID=UPI0020B1BC8A|nr:sciellin isoform X3 [Brienomyrus brachyistius]